MSDDLPKVRVYIEHSLDGNQLAEVMEEVYGMDRDESLFCFFVEGFGNGDHAYHTASKPSKKHELLTLENIRAIKRAKGYEVGGDILTDLVARKLLKAGSYRIDIDW